MNRLTLLAACMALLLSGASLRASDPVGIYAIIDKVVLEPNDEAPERAQVWGAFSFATGPGMGDTYFPPARGYLYYSIEPGNEKVTRIEWNDLKSQAGTQKFLGFGSRYMPTGTVRSACDVAAKPDVYPIALGIMTLRTDTEYQPIRDLVSMPAPISPADGASVTAGIVPLVVRNILTDQHPSARYVFQLINRYGEVLQSPQIEPSKGQTEWIPSVPVEAGTTYTWKAYAMEGDWVGPTAIACFQLPFLRGDANGDISVDISDAVAVLFFLFAGGAEPTPIASGDSDGNGHLELTDAIYLLTYLFQGGTAPPPPYPERGLLPSST